MSSSRIRGEIVDIPEDEVLNFFESRAQKINPSHPLTSVMYQDNHPEIAEQRDIKEKEKILPLLQLTGNESVLDIGCGIGRWANVLYQKVHSYIGIDASAGLINQANRLLKKDNVVFLEACADRFFSSDLIQKKAPFDLFIIAGLFMYLNDYQVSRVLDGIIASCAKKAVVYIREPLAVNGDRLTLKDFWSEELSSNYSAIYRSETEFSELLNKYLIPHGFAPVKFDNLFEEGSLNNRNETRQKYCIIHRE